MEINRKLKGHVYPAYRTGRRQAGFTLVELLVVIAIIGLLASVVIVSVGSARAKSRDARRVSDMKALGTAIELYKDGNGGNAPADSGTFATDMAALVPTHIGKVPSDPKGGAHPAYTYDNTGGDETYVILFTTESDSSIGVAGDYCHNSAGIEDEAAGGTGTCDER